MQLMNELVGALDEARPDRRSAASSSPGSERAFAAGADIGEMADASAMDMLAQRRVERWDSIPDAPDAARRGGLGLLPGRRLRARDGLRPHRRVGDREVRPARDRARDHPRRRRNAAADPRRREGEGDGRDPHRPLPRRTRGERAGSSRASSRARRGSTRRSASRARSRPRARSRSSSRRRPSTGPSTRRSSSASTTSGSTSTSRSPRTTPARAERVHREARPGLRSSPERPAGFPGSAPDRLNWNAARGVRGRLAHTSAADGFELTERRLARLSALEIAARAVDRCAVRRS